MLVFGERGQVARALAAAAGGRPLTLAGRDRLDLLDASADIAGLIDAVRPAAVINAAAYTAVDRAETETDACVRLNRDAPTAMARACADRGIPLVHFSTDYVFDGEKGAPYEEPDAPAPLNAYGRAKAEGEAALERAWNGGAPIAVIRTSRVFSAAGSGFLQAMLRLAKAGGEVRAVADQVACPTPAAACAEAASALTEALLANEGNARGFFHAAGAEGVSWAAFAEAIFAASARAGGPSAHVTPVPATAFATAARRPRDSRLACARLEALTDWRAPPLAKSLARCLQEMQLA